MSCPYSKSAIEQRRADIRNSQLKIERLAREKAENAERERIAREKADRRRIAREKAERERVARMNAESMLNKVENLSLVRYQEEDACVTAFLTLLRDPLYINASQRVESPASSSKLIYLATLLKVRVDLVSDDDDDDDDDDNDDDDDDNYNNINNERLFRCEIRFDGFEVLDLIPVNKQWSIDLTYENVFTMYSILSKDGSGSLHSFRWRNFELPSIPAKDAPLSEHKANACIVWSFVERVFKSYPYPQEVVKVLNLDSELLPYLVSLDDSCGNKLSHLARLWEEKYDAPCGNASEYMHLVTSLQELRDRLRHDQLQAMIKDAVAILDTTRAKSLLEYKKSIKLSAVVHKVEDLLFSCQYLIDSNKEYFRHIVDIDFGKAESCSHFVSYITELTVILQHAKCGTVEASILAIDNWLGRVNGSFTASYALVDANRGESLSQEKVEFVLSTETSYDLGLSESLTSRYLAVLANLEEFRDQDAVKKVLGDIEAAKKDMNTNLLKELIAKKKTLVAGKVFHGLGDLTKLLVDLIADVKRFYESVVDKGLDSKADFATAERCVVTCKFAEALLSSISSRDTTKLFSQLAQRKQAIPKIQDTSKAPTNSKAADSSNSNSNSRCDSNSSSDIIRIFSIFDIKPLVEIDAALDKEEEAEVLSSSSPISALNACSVVQEEKASLLGISEQLTARYTSLLDTMEEYVDQDQVVDINARMEMAKMEPSLQNVSMLKQLHALKKSLKVGSRLHIFKDLSANLLELIQEIKVYYEKSLIVDIDTHEVACHRCSMTFKYLKEVESCAANREKLSLVLGKRVSSLESHRSIRPLREIRDAIDHIALHSSDVELDVDLYTDIQEETPVLLGLSEELVSSYTALLDTLEQLRDQDVVQSLNARLEKAKVDLDTATLRKLKEQLKHLKVGKAAHSHQDLSTNLAELIQGISSYFRCIVEDEDNMDDLKAQRCSITVKYLKDLQACVGDNFKLAAVLRRRLVPRYQDNLVFPDKVKRLDWANVRVDSTGGVTKKDLILGSGSFSDVLKAQLDIRGDMRDVAIKVLKQVDIEEYDKLCLDALKEAEIIAGATHRMFSKSGIVALYGVAVGTLTSELASFFNVREGEKRVGLVLGYEPTSLHKVLYPDSGQLKLKLSLSVEQKISLVKSLTDSLRNLHRAGCVHGDLKPQNILLSGDANNFQVKLADFNISDLREAQESATTKGSTLQQTKSFRGTKAYCAVEQLPDPSKPDVQVCKASRRTDIYSLGVIIWEIFSGKAPHHELGNNEGALCLKVYGNGRPSQPSVDEIPDMPLALREVVERCWSADRSSRPSAVECHSAVTQIQNVILKNSFDIFFSHCWADKDFLSHVHALLTGLGYRVWYDMYQMGWNQDKSMIEGVGNSKVFLCCFNRTYETRPNCLFELQECRRRHPDKPVVALVMENMYNSSSPWSIKQECKNLLSLGLQRGNSMYCDISRLASNPAWRDPNTKDCIHPDLMKELESAMQPLLRILNDLKCTPSFGSKTGGGHPQTSRRRLPEE
jgi:serine/threonine protein kinase